MNLKSRLMQRARATFLTAAMIIGVGLLVNEVLKYNVIIGVLAISLFNAELPKVIKSATMLTERHDDVGSVEISLFLKSTMVRWANTAILIFALNDTSNTISNGDEDSSRNLLAEVFTIFIGEITTSPILKYLDIVGNINRHILAPRSVSQSKMITYFSGTPYYVAERYAVSISSPQEFTGRIISLTCFNLHKRTQQNYYF